MLWILDKTGKAKTVKKGAKEWTEEPFTTPFLRPLASKDDLLRAGVENGKRKKKTDKARDGETKGINFE